jgi:hypothetical protein
VVQLQITDLLLLTTTTMTPILSTTRSSVIDDHLPMLPSLPFPIVDSIAMHRDHFASIHSEYYSYTIQPEDDARRSK